MRVTECKKCKWSYLTLIFKETRCLVILGERRMPCPLYKKMDESLEQLKKSGVLEEK